MNDFAMSIKEAWRLSRIEANHAPALHEVMLFLATHVSFRGISKWTRARITSAIGTILRYILWPGFDNWVMNIHSQTHNLSSQPRLLRRPSRRLTGAIDAETVWALLERSRLTFSLGTRNLIEALNDLEECKLIAASNAGT